MLSFLKFDASTEKKAQTVPEKQLPVVEQPAKLPEAKPPVEVAPPVPAPKPQTVPASELKKVPADIVTVPSDEIVPATGKVY